MKLLFDFLPIEAMTIKGFKTKFQLYTVPGQVVYNTTRQLVLRGVDGIVFVAEPKGWIRSGVGQRRRVGQQIAHDRTQLSRGSDPDHDALDVEHHRAVGLRHRTHRPSIGGSGSIMTGNVDTAQHR